MAGYTRIQDLEGPDERDERAQGTWSRPLSSVSLGCLVLMGVVLLGGLSTQQHSFSTPSALMEALGYTPTQQLSKSSLTLAVRGEYKGNHPGAHYPYIRSDRVVEPARTTTLTLSTDAEGVSLLTCIWSIKSHGGQGQAYSKSPMTVVDEYYTTDFDSGQTDTCTTHVQFPTPGQYSLTIGLKTDAGEIFELEEKVECYYVRREIHSLSERDWERFLDSFQVLATTSTEEGKKTYGEYYLSISSISATYLENVGRREYDHIHGGMGMMTQHMSLSSQFERAMQAVDPSFALPYWDYTIDEQEVNQLAQEGDVRSGGYAAIVGNSLFGEEYFGNVGSSDGLHAIANGRFAFQRVEVDESAAVRSPYGFLRARWNLNPSPYVTRYHEMCGIEARSEYAWPSCASHYKMVYEVDSFYQLTSQIEQSPHEPVHVWIGGMGGGCSSWSQDSYPFNLLSNESFEHAKQLMFTMLKAAYRSGAVEYPETCSMDDISTDQLTTMMSGRPRDFESGCEWTCKLERMDEFTDLLEDVGEMDVSTLTDDQKQDLVKKMFCSETYWPGDHLDAASVVEASFYPIHPTLDRLLQFRMLANPFTDGNGDWQNPEGETSYCNVEGAACVGHHPDDLTVFPVILKDTDGVFKMGYKTNAEVLASADPSSKSYGLPYVYDHFEWTHCSELGYAFEF